MASNSEKLYTILSKLVSLISGNLLLTNEKQDRINESNQLNASYIEDLSGAVKSINNDLDMLTTSGALNLSFDIDTQTSPVTNTSSVNSIEALSIEPNKFYKWDPDVYMSNEDDSDSEGEENESIPPTGYFTVDDSVIDELSGKYAISMLDIYVRQPGTKFVILNGLHFFRDKEGTEDSLSSPGDSDGAFLINHCGVIFDGRKTATLYVYNVEQVKHDSNPSVN